MVARLLEFGNPSRNGDPVTFTKSYLAETVDILQSLDGDAIERCVETLAQIRARGGRLFILGVGGSAATASHAVNDFRKICRFDAYAPTDNVAELTARTNDSGWSSTFVSWLDVSRLCERDGILVLSVGGGNQTASPNIVFALSLAVEADATILGVVGRDGGHTASVAKACVTIPPLIADRITPHTEGVASVIMHLIVSHPLLAP